MSHSYTADFDLIDQSYSSKNEELHLFLLLDFSGINYCTFHEKDRCFVGLSQQQFSPFSTWANFIEEASKALRIFTENKTFKKIGYAWRSELYSLIPKNLIDDSKIEEVLWFNHEKSPIDQSIFSNELLLEPYSIAFAIPKLVHETMLSFFPKIKVIHEIEGLINHEKEISKELLINVRDHQVDLLVFKDGLELANTFAYQSAEDLLYFTLYVMEQHQLDPNVAKVKLIGKIETNGEIYQLLFKYLKDCNIDVNITDFNFSSLFKEVPSHYFKSLYSLVLCG